jgi:hypothetical protein
MKLKTVGKIADVADKGKGALVTFELTSFDEKTKKKVFTNFMNVFIRGLGGFNYKGSPKN